ncbi:fibronectin-III type domain-containing protein windei isoform X1 [Megachile rotundata]|uniref:fibronectin-III type domain-containing protein windei isoform X1 n=1 Tax=Megachile rotundata TaxID=143995 RepID=UPI003FD1D24C
METLRNDTVHTPDSISSLSCINTHINELSKEKEEELLYGAGDDGDEEDALSDDSIRLRLSDDDEIESENVLADVLDNQQNKLQDCNIDIAKSEDVNPPVLEKNVVKNNMIVNEISKKEDYSCDVSLDEKMVTDPSKDIKTNDIEIARSPIINMPRRPNYEPQWRFTNSPNMRSFRGVNHPSFNRYRYLTPRGHYRLQAYDYNSRFHNNFLPFEQARNCGKFNSYNMLPYNNRQQKRGFKPSIISRNFNGSPESYPNNASSSNTNISKTEIDNDVIVVSANASDINEKDNVSDNECLIINDKNDDKSHELLDKKVDCISNDTSVREGNQEDTTSINDSLESKQEIKLKEGSSLPNDDKCTNVSMTENSTSNDTCKETLLSSHNSNEHTEKINTSNATATTIDIDKEEIQHVDNVCASDKSELNTSESVDKQVELSEKRDKDVLNNLEEKLIVNNEKIINGKVTNDEIEEICKKQDEDVFVQNEKSNEDDKNVINTNSIIVNDLTNDKNDNEIKVVEDVSVESVVKNGVCDNDQLKNNNSTNLNKEVTSEDQLTNSEIDLQEQTVNTAEENAQCKEKEAPQTNSTNSTIKLSDIIESVLDRDNLFNVKSQNESLGFATDGKGNSDNDKTTDEATAAAQRKRKRTKKTIAGAAEDATEEDKQAKEIGRQKRQTAKNAEEIIRKKFLNHDSDVESSDDSEKFVAVNHNKMNQDVRPLSPPSLKRNYADVDSTIMNGNVKKIKINSQEQPEELISKENNSQNIKNLNYVHKFFQRDLKEKLPKLKQEELEELLIQKIVETITMRGEIGKLREQARISERNQEATRQKCQQLAKQIKDFEMVLSRNAADRRANNDKPVPPIKINRSVGLQVNFVTDHGIQNLRQLQQNSNMKALQMSNNNTSNIPNSETNNATSPRKGIKIRSPRRTEPINAQPPVVSQNHTQSPNILPALAPAPLVVTKPVDIQHNLTLPIQSTVQMISNQQMQSQPTQQTIVLNGKLPNQIPNRQSTVAANIAAQTRTNDLIDLTDEEEKSKAVNAPVSTSTISESQINLPQNPQPCFQRVIQTIPGNVAIASQPPSIRVVQPASQPTPTALVNNMNAPRLTYVMQSSVGPTRQLLIAPNSTPMRPVTSCNRASFSTVTYKTGISTVANGTVRVLTTPATTNLQLPKHPAPLPDTRNYVANPLWKLPPPAPSLKISKVANGIVLSWNMNLSDKYADIASYQLYAYQEITGIPPNTSLWKKVGDVRALPLPMACTLTQFSEGNNYYFAVRAVDTHSRKGQYSIPSNISL